MKQVITIHSQKLMHEPVYEGLCTSIPELTEKISDLLDKDKLVHLHICAAELPETYEESLDAYIRQISVRESQPKQPK